MLARWPVLYPEISGAAEENADEEAARVREEIRRPLLDSGDLVHTYKEARERYRSWKDSLATAEWDQETVVAQEARFEDALVATFEEHRAELGEQTVRGTRETVNLRRIVRKSVIPHRETWPEESWERIAHLMTMSELCWVVVLEFITNGEDMKENALTLARWGFQYALDAYWALGTTGRMPPSWRTYRSERQTASTGRDLMTLDHCSTPTPSSEWKETSPRGVEPWKP